MSASTEFELRCDLLLARAMQLLARRDDRGVAAGAALRERIEQLELQMVRRETPAGPMAELFELLELSPVQADFLWAAIAFTSDPRIAIHAEALAGSAGKRGLTVSLFVQLFEIRDATGPALARWLAEGQPLMDDGLVSCVDVGVTLPNRPYVAAPRLIAYAARGVFLEARLRIVETTAAHVFDDSQLRVLSSLAAILEQPGAVVVVEGPAGGGRASAIARATQRVVALLDTTDLAIDALRDGLLALRLECLLRDALPVIGNVDSLTADGVRLVGQAIGRWHRPIAVTAATPNLDIGVRRALVRVAWPVPQATTRAALWCALGGASPGEALDVLAMRYAVGPGTIARASASARLLCPGVPRLETDALAAGLRHNISERLAGIAQRVDVTQGWNDLVLADETREQVNALIARLRHAHQVLDRWGYRRKLARGGGVAALLSGPPGTGKTMVAGLVARELDLELYQVDLSQVVSKWVGETEKQLARVFDVAEQGHALLLFDEADALFGQRTTETHSAVDRYANLEVNYLLQRVESFGGVTILTTNLDTAIDAALKRRLAAHIVFDLPEEEERAQLWSRQISTASAPLAANLDLPRLARDFPKMSGANIRNAALAAAFFAAADHAPVIDQEHLLRAARVEYRSMGYVLAERRGLG